ncbi:MAG: hypothetical protein QM655_17105 [Nocardioidaceae bacterium]
MKTTVELPDELLRQVKDVSQREGVTMRELLIEGLRTELARRQAPLPHVDFVFTSFGGEGLAPDLETGDVIATSYGLPT